VVKLRPQPKNPYYVLSKSLGGPHGQYGGFGRKKYKFRKTNINPLHIELNPICHLLALLEAHHILHVSRIRVKVGNFLRKTPRFGHVHSAFHSWIPQT
jgi:hypothetical protein